MGSQRLTIFLLTTDVMEPGDALDTGGEQPFTEQDVSASAGFSGIFYSKYNQPRFPEWAKYVSPVLESNLDVRTASASGLLILNAADRYFALSFGFGRSFLDPSKIERRFGLKVALNRIDTQQIRSLDTKTFEDMVVSKTTQTSKNAELSNFGVDAVRDLLRAVTGKPSDESLGRTITGSDALVLTTKLAVKELPILLAELLVAYEDDAYKARFEWIDHLAEVKDPSNIAALDALLVVQLQAGDTTRTHLAMPENFGWDEISGFKIGGAGRRQFEDLDLDEYLEVLGDERGDLSLEHLKSRRVQVGWIKSGNFDTRWSLYNALVSEQDFDGKLFALIEGRWFEVAATLVSAVDNYLESLPEAETTLPPAYRSESEGAYNERVARQSADLLLLDKQLARAADATSSIEFCDLLSVGAELIHVKRKSRSATRSHLFAQGNISANTLIGDGAFRDSVRLQLGEIAGEDSARWLELVPGSDGRPDRARYTVHFAVLTNSKGTGAGWLPFFSKLNLMQTAKQIQSLGPTVVVSRVPVETVPSM
ncbi:TIGR04141 family sporadically distributed protein [Microbacterium sp. STN6]|uniref:DUF6119 family protein n=1 Tax=Microbacterium sp. STN6 TaxID=2995588 RepID=UPI00226086C0|nr:DUF6119 family protein [Microbacterium sp. STN6]MCX7523429.1 TIGR04141 family sporadically distributed protein [Microbacterium sp. STN6]